MEKVGWWGWDPSLLRQYLFEKCFIHSCSGRDSRECTNFSLLVSAPGQTKRSKTHDLYNKKIKNAKSSIFNLLFFILFFLAEIFYLAVRLLTIFGFCWRWLLSKFIRYLLWGWRIWQSPTHFISGPRPMPRRKKCSRTNKGNPDC